MSISANVLVALGNELATWLAKRYLGDRSQGATGDLTVWGAQQIPDVIQRRNAARQFERFADEILLKLQESFESRRKQPPVLNADTVCNEVSGTLADWISEHFLVAKEIDPRIVVAELREQHPLPADRLPDLEARVYEQVLDEVVRYLVEVASLLPRFQTAVAAESLKRLSHLGQDVTDVLNTIRRLEARVVEAGDAPDDARWEADYRAAVVRQLDRVELFGADIPPEAQRNLLSEAFVSLNVERSGGDDDRDKKPQAKIAGPKHRLLTCEELFNSLDVNQGRVLIRGSAGCGKTTLLRWAAIQAAKADPGAFGLVRIVEHFGGVQVASPFDIRLTELAETTDDEFFQFQIVEPTRFWGWRMPFVIPLRHCQSGKLPAPDDLSRLIATEVGRPPAEWVRTVLTEGRALVMLDGVDEVPAQNRGLLKDEIKAIVEAYPDCYFVLTSRPAAIPDDWLDELGFRNADVSPLSLPDIERFVRRWHEATGKELARQGRPDANLAADAERLIEQFHQNPPLSLLATNPLLCAMICALHRVRHHKLPESQYELCETLCHMLLHKRERESHLNWQDFPAAYIALSYEQKRGIAQQLAQWLMQNGQSAMPLETAYEQVARALQRIPGRTADEAPLILTTLVERSGLLREPNPDVVDFLHNTFKELLAGDDVAGRGDCESIVQHLDDESWRRVGLFAVASPRSQTFASALVSKLLEPLGGDIKKLKARCRTDKTLLRTVLFVLQCRRVAEFLDEPLKVHADKLVSVPFPPADFEAAAAIAQMGDDAVEPLLGTKKLSSQQTAATVRALRLINTRTSRDALQQFVNSDDWDVIAELAPAMNPLTIPKVIAAIQSSDEMPESIRKLIGDVSPLAGLTTLQDLDLNGTGVTDVGPLAGLTRLIKLNLSGTGVSDLNPLAGLTNLQHLILGRTDVSDLSPLAGLTSLQGLYLNRTRVTDLSSLACLTSLHALVLYGTAVSDLSPLTSLTSLQWLELSGTAVSDLSPLTGLTSLQWLELNDTAVSDLNPLAGLMRLIQLYLSGTHVTDVSPLAGLTSLQYLDLNFTGVSDLSPLADLKGLQISGVGTDDVTKKASETLATIHKQVGEPVRAASGGFWLSRLDVANWRGYQRRAFAFGEQVTVLIGNNGTGKSSTLEALAMGLAAWTGAFHETAQRRLEDSDVHRRRIYAEGELTSESSPRIEPQFKVSVECFTAVDGQDWRWRREWTGLLSEEPAIGNVWALAAKTAKQIQEGGTTLLPLVAYYGTPRNPQDAQLTAADTLPPLSRRDGYAHCFTPAADVRQLKLLMKTRALLQANQRRAAPDFVAVQQAVLNCLSRTEFAAENDAPPDAVPPNAKIDRFEWDLQADELVIGFDDGRQLSFRMLSDGQRTTIALVADIARRAATLNPQLGAEAAAQCPGIVLIDEIELHLHPRWQRTIVGDLRETFPLLQFVMTTHSPLIIQSCRPGEVINLDGLSAGRDYSEMSPEDILEYEQGLPDSPRSRRMLAMREAAEKYYAALRDAQSVSDEERERLKHRLDELAEPFTNEPGFYAFLRLKRAAAGVEE